MGKNPKQCPDNLLEFNKLLNSYLNAKGKTPSWLARRTGLSTTTITRLLNSTDYRGGCNQPKERTVVLICAALGLNFQQRWELYNLAFPEHKIYMNALNNGDSVNEILNSLETADSRK